MAQIYNQIFNAELSAESGNPGGDTCGKLTVQTVPSDPSRMNVNPCSVNYIFPNDGGGTEANFGLIFPATWEAGNRCWIKLVDISQNCTQISFVNGGGLSSAEFLYQSNSVSADPVLIAFVMTLPVLTLQLVYDGTYIHVLI